MATIDLGKIKQVFRGTYNNATAYVPDDLVVFTDGTVTSTYICTTASTGNNPSSGGTAHANWAFVAKGQASSPTTTRGDLIVRGASADERLAIGTAGQVLKVNGAANGFEFGTGAKILQVVNSTKLDKTSFTSSGSTYQSTGIQVTITPTAASSKIIVIAAVSCSANSGYRHAIKIQRSINGGSFAVPTGFQGNQSGNQVRAGFMVGNPSSNAHMSSLTLNHVDTPSYSVGNAIIYRVYGIAESNGPFYVNRSSSDGDDANYYSPMSAMTAIEVAA